MISLKKNFLIFLMIFGFASSMIQQTKAIDCKDILSYFVPVLIIIPTACAIGDLAIGTDTSFARSIFWGATFAALVCLRTRLKDQWEEFNERTILRPVPVNNGQIQGDQEPV